MNPIEEKINLNDNFLLQTSKKNVNLPKKQEILIKKSS
jgi:hypothetical protein